MRDWGCEHCGRITYDAPRFCDYCGGIMCFECTEEHDEHDRCPGAKGEERRRDKKDQAPDAATRSDADRDQQRGTSRNT